MKPETPKPPTSLRRQFLLWLIGPLIVYLFINSLVILEESNSTAREVRDRLLLGAARFVANQVKYEEDAYWAYIPTGALELFQTSDRDRVFFAVYSPEGDFICGDPRFKKHLSALKDSESIHFDTRVGEDTVRATALGQALAAKPGDPPLVIQVGETHHARRALVRQVWYRSVQGETVMIIILISLAWITSGRGLRNVLDLRDRVLARQPGSLEPLEALDFPTELRPLVDAVNDYIRRLDSQMSAHSRFISNAAHQLRTPLAILQTQVSYCLKSEDLAHKNETLVATRNSLKNYARVVNQLMTFSAAEAHHHQPHSDVATDLVETARKVLIQWASQADARGIDLGFHGLQDPIWVKAPSSLLFELMANLVDNAIRYTQKGGVVTLRVRLRSTDILLQVEDDGPGIPSASRECVFERFVRLADTQGDGCGLGLSIVREIATSIGAQVELSEPPSGQGLLVTVRFPMN